MAAISIICAPFHAGARAERVGAGPLRLLDDGIADALSRSGYQVRVTEIGSVDGFEGEIGRSFEVKRRVARAVAEAGEAGEFPIVLSGNCNVAVGVWSGLGRLDAGLVWFDAHPDFDTPEEHRSGYLDGMGVATLAGQCWRNLAGSIPGFTPFDLSRLTYCGIRDFEPGQLEKVKASGIAAAVGSKDRPTNYAAALRGQLDRAPFREAMIHLDLDCLDTSVGMANEYAAPGGLLADELQQCLEIACSCARPLSLTIASFNPTLEGAERISAAGIDAAMRVASFA